MNKKFKSNSFLKIKFLKDSNWQIFFQMIIERFFYRSTLSFSQYFTFFWRASHLSNTSSQSVSEFFKILTNQIKLLYIQFVESYEFICKFQSTDSEISIFSFFDFSSRLILLFTKARTIFFMKAKIKLQELNYSQRVFLVSGSILAN